MCDCCFEWDWVYPCLVHVVQLRAGGVVDAHEVVFVGERCAVVVDGCGEEVRVQFGIVREVVVGEDHCFVRVDAHVVLGFCCFDVDDRVVGDHEPLHVVFDLDVDAVVFGCCAYCFDVD